MQLGAVNKGLTQLSLRKRFQCVSQILHTDATKTLTLKQWEEMNNVAQAVRAD